MNKLYQNNDNELDHLRLLEKDSSMTGLQKLQALFTTALESPRQDDMFQMAPDFLKNPQMLAMQIEGIYTESVPHFVQPIIEEGIADGSIKTDYPKELAELILLLIRFLIRMQSSGLRNFARCTIKKINFCLLGSFILKLYIPSFGIYIMNVTSTNKKEKRSVLKWNKK